MDLTETAVFRIDATQVNRLFKFGPFDSLVNSIASLLLLAAAWISSASMGVMLLVLIPIPLAIIRWLIAYSYNQKARPGAAVKRWELFFNAATIVAALSWGAITAYLISTGISLVSVAAIGLVTAISLSAVVLYAGSYAITLGFSGAALALPAVVAAMRADPTGALLCAFLVGIFAIAVTCARIIKRIVWESAVASAEIEQMTSHLDQRRTQVEKLNVALKTNADKREQAEITLRRTAADLGLVQGKAKALADTLERVSPMCQVTGLANRRHFNEQLQSEWRRATREQKPMSLVIIEVDEFEEYVTAYGLQSTDALLKRVGQTLKGFGRRSGDLAGRYDDVKLALMLPGCDARNAARMAEAVRKRIESTKIAHSGASNRDVLTIHVGVATIKPARGLNPEELTKRSEAALYEARFQGGNKIVIYKPLSKLKLERWDQPNDGALNEQSLTQKLLVWGYDTSKDILRPGEEPRQHVSESETVIAILSGELLIDVEGHTMAIKAGDSIFVPPRVALLLQVSGEHPVIKFTATKSQ